jgi:hypothetical protein
MVQLIVGSKGLGKTQYLIDQANEAVKNAAGHVVYIDKSTRHMFELSNKIRLIDASRYPLKNGDEFIGFICGVLSQDHDLEKIFLDSFTKNMKMPDDPALIREYVDQLEVISTKFKVDFVISISLEKEELDETLQKKVVISL